jgi:hypothetical protein
MGFKEQVISVILMNAFSGMIFYTLGFKEGKREGILRGKFMARKSVSQ